MPSAEIAVKNQLFLFILVNLSEFGPLNVCTPYVLNYMKGMSDIIWSFALMVLVRCLNIHVPKCFWLQRWILHSSQRPRAEVWTGIQQDPGQWQGAVKERQEVPAWVQSSAPAPWATGPRYLQSPLWPLLPC